MKKSTYLIIVFLLSLGYLNYLPVTNLTPDILLVVSWFWGIVGLVKYRKFSKNRLNVIANKKYVYWFIALMLISTLYPFIVYNQSILSTIIAQRANYSILFLIVFLYIHPNEQDFITALRFCTYLSILIMVISIVVPSYFISVEKLDNLQSRQSEGSYDLITAAPGIALLFFYFLFQLQKFFFKPKSKVIFEVLFLFLVILFLQNRSRLIVTIPLFLYAFYRLKSKIKLVYWIFTFIVTAVFSSYIFGLITNLWQESSGQLYSSEYGRWQSIIYFILEEKSNIFTMLFGHGSPAEGSEYLKLMSDAQQYRFAYLADIGLLGSYYLYGLSFVGIIYSFVFKALKKKQPYYLKFFACFIIFVPTIQGFGIFDLGSAILYAMFFYLVIYHLHYQKINDYISQQKNQSLNNSQLHKL